MKKPAVEFLSRRSSVPLASRGDRSMSSNSSLGSAPLLPTFYKPTPSSGDADGCWNRSRMQTLIYMTVPSLAIAFGGVAVSPSKALYQSTDDPHAKSHFRTMVMVAGHSVYKTHDFSDPSANANWFLVSYQQKPGQAASFVEHIKLGVEAAAADDQAVLIFSGGYTREEAGAVSEAGSYWQVADALHWFGHPEVKQRALLEDRARDSLENFMFSICRFRQFTGTYPQAYTVVSYDFKKKRFIEAHAAALGISAKNMKFLGTPAIDHDGAKKGEADTLADFEKDPYACRGELLDKKKTRDPFHNGTPDAGTCPALKPFLDGTCRKSLYTGPLPWRERPKGRLKFGPM